LKRKQGGISIFLAIVFLTLVAFSCSIVEVTRYQIARIQAERALLSATQSVLGGYDHILKNEYGIFARDMNYSDLYFIDGSGESPDENLSPMANDLKYYLEGNIHNDPNRLEKSLIDEFGSVKHPSPFKLIPLELEDMKVSASNPLISHEGLDYVKKDMVAFMELRAPLLLIEPFLEKVMVIEKLGKTTTFIQSKDTIIEETHHIEDAYLNLYRWIEGIDIKPSSGKVTVVEGNFVKIILPKVKVQIPEISVIQVEEIKRNLANKEMNISRLAPSFDEAYIQFKAHILELKQSQDKQVDLKDRQDRVRDQIRSLRDKLVSEEDPDRAASIKKEISNKQKRVKELSSQIKEVEELKQKQVAELTTLFRTMDEIMKKFGGLALGADSVLEMNVKARDEIDWIKDKGENLEQKIDGFVNREKKNQENYIVRTFDYALEELETIKTSYGASMRKDNFDTLGNLSYMHERLVDNIQLLEKQKPVIQKVVNEYPAMIAGCFEDAGLSKQELMILNKGQVYGPLKVGVEHYGTKTMGYPTIKKDVQTICDLVSTYYRKDLFFDYSDYGLNGQVTINGTSVEGKGFYNNVKSNVSGLDVQNIFDEVLPVEYPFDNTLPSARMLFDKEISNEEDDGSEETALTALDGKLFSNLTQMGKDFKDLVLLNEYAIGMFTTMTGKYNDDQEALTLSGYKKKDHVLDSELEYIVTGKKNQLEAVTTISTKIVGMRIALNTIHLVTDPSKRTIIMNLANAVAGWWSLGVGALAIALIIGLLWATAESLVDLVMLLQGQKVPLLKTKTTWFLGPENLTSEVIERGGEIALKKTQDSLKGLQDKTQKWIVGLKGDLSEEVNGLLEKQIQTMHMEGVGMADAMAQSYEDDLFRKMDGILLSYNEGTALSDGSISDYPRSDSRYEILEMFKQDVASATRNKEITQSLLSEIKRDLQASYTLRIEKHKELIISEASEITDQGFDLLEHTVNQQIEVLAKKGEQISADFILEQTEHIKKDTGIKLLEKSPTVDPKAKGEQLTEFIPTACYEDYLRFFMLMDWKKLDERVLRMLDVIEINMKKGKDKVSWTLADYVLGLDSRASFKVRYGFINVMPGFQERKSRFKGHHSFVVEVGNGYE
jgi:hypothetical protein